MIKYHFMYMVGDSAAFVVQRNAIYIRVQLAGTNQLSLTEVVVSYCGQCLSAQHTVNGQSHIP